MAALFSHPVFTGLGAFALEFYLLSMPLLTLWEAHLFRDGYYTSLLSVSVIWLVAALVSTLLVRPLVSRVLRCFPTEVSPGQSASLGSSLGM